MESVIVFLDENGNRNSHRVIDLRSQLFPFHCCSHLPTLNVNVSRSIHCIPAWPCPRAGMRRLQRQKAYYSIFLYAAISVLMVAITTSFTQSNITPHSSTPTTVPLLSSVTFCLLYRSRLSPSLSSSTSLIEDPASLFYLRSRAISWRCFLGGLSQPHEMRRLQLRRGRGALPVFL